MNNMTPFDTIENLLELAASAHEAKTLLLNEKLKNSLSAGRKMVDTIITVLNERGYTSIKSIQDLPVSPVVSSDSPLFYDILHDALLKMHSAKSDCILQELKFTQFDAQGRPSGKGTSTLLISSGKGMIKAVVEMELSYPNGKARASIGGCEQPTLEVDGDIIEHGTVSHRIATDISLIGATLPGLFPQRSKGTVLAAQTLLSTLATCAQGLPTLNDVSLTVDYLRDLK